MKKKSNFESIRIDFVLVFIILLLGPIAGLIFSKTNLFDNFKPKVETFDEKVFFSKNKIIFSSTKSTDLEALFLHLKIDLQKIRQGQAMPNIEILSLPKDLSSIESSERRKNIFFSSILPIIVRENLKILKNRKQLCKAINVSDTRKIEEIAFIYNINIENIEKLNINETLINKIDAIPVSLAMAQAAIESGWGTSRFSLEGNALYGQWAWKENAGIKPKEALNSKAVVRSFKNLSQSVKAYMINLNTHNAYSGMRSKRKRSCANEKLISGFKLSNWMGNYATTRDEYIKILRSVIKGNDLKPFDSIIF